ncbi:hypothetical protein L202_08063 [Cryptococcus amylolentus CBS 6039]|uniref:Uncharacterized protein n=1 Tax=Cryptococcus amylolentus CBS 6039 TaxID=1295533 RepID=A0A1E3HB53_9TREE|nr:hypothetical protein L202_08063 [Cryptococcus amylolentus CBS 6039]ODN73563.1 hypothetical protein L202_08063 [Cryptococcus amylolentus CBS 6039]
MSSFTLDDDFTPLPDRPDWLLMHDSLKAILTALHAEIRNINERTEKHEAQGLKEEVEKSLAPIFSRIEALESSLASLKSTPVPAATPTPRPNVKFVIEAALGRLDHINNESIDKAKKVIKGIQNQTPMDEKAALKLARVIGCMEAMTAKSNGWQKDLCRQSLEDFRGLLRGSQLRI